MRTTIAINPPPPAMLRFFVEVLQRGEWTLEGGSHVHPEFANQSVDLWAAYGFRARVRTVAQRGSR